MTVMSRKAQELQQQKKHFRFQSGLTVGSGSLKLD